MKTFELPDVGSVEEICDLRTALGYLRRFPGELAWVESEVDPDLELAAVFRQLGAGVPMPPPSREGPAVVFERVKGYGMPVVAGVLASRKRAGLLLGAEMRDLPRVVLKALEQPLAPRVIASGARCQQVVRKPPFDLRAILPAIRHTAQDAGPYITLGLLWAQDPETGQSDVTIHRMCVQGPERLSVYFVPGRHIDQFRAKAEKAGGCLPVSINIGLDPAIYLASCFEPPTTPLGTNELEIAGALRGRPVELVPCVEVNAMAIASAEIVLEGEILPGERVREDVLTGRGFSMPEFPGYMGKAQPQVPVIRIKAITHRKNPIYEALVSPGAEHANLTGIPTEASILKLVEDTMPGRLVGVYCHPAGGGKYVAIVQMRKLSESDEGRPRQAALAALAAFPELKHVILVDEDVDIFNTDEVLWAMTTRYQGDASTVLIPGVRGHALDPSQSPEFSPYLRAEGVTCKTVFDCTVPYRLKERFKRPEFADVDLSRYKIRWTE